MTTRLPISAFIIAKNEADRIPLAINSLKDWVEELYVVDSGSTDGTMDLCRELGATVEFRAWEGYGPQKNYGESLCRNMWLLNLDADEEVTPELRAEIEVLFAAGEPPRKAYSVTRKQMHFIENTGTYGMTDRPIRLYHKEYASFKNSTVHDSVTWKGAPQMTGHLNGVLNHRTFRSYTHMVDKINFYSTMQAEDMFRRGKCPSTLRILIEPLFAFFKAYILRAFITRGITGYLEAVVYAFGRTLRLAKTRALFIAHDSKR